MGLIQMRRHTLNVGGNSLLTGIMGLLKKTKQAEDEHL